MISEIDIGEVSAEYVSHATLVAKINELIRAQNAVELAATDNQQLKAEIRAISDYLQMCSYANFTSDKYDITKRRLRELSAI